MKKKLAKRLGKRFKFRGKVERYGVKDGFRGQQNTVLLTDVILVDTGAVVADHLWFEDWLLRW